MPLVCLVSQDPPDPLDNQETTASLGRQVLGDSQASKGLQELWEPRDLKVNWETEDPEAPRCEGLRVFLDLLVFLVSQESPGTERTAEMAREDLLVSPGWPASLGPLALLDLLATATLRPATSRQGFRTPV